jgi:hypothetical protein
MFGSGYNPYKAAAYAEMIRKIKENAWGMELRPIPQNINIDDLTTGAGGEINETLYKSLMEQSGAAERLLKQRKEAAKYLAALPRVKTETEEEATDNYGRKYTETHEIWIIDKLPLEYAELVVLRRAQHPDKKHFWEVLYNKIEELIGVKIRM